MPSQFPAFVSPPTKGSAVHRPRPGVTGVVPVFHVMPVSQVPFTRTPGACWVFIPSLSMSVCSTGTVSARALCLGRAGLGQCDRDTRPLGAGLRGRSEEASGVRAHTARAGWELRTDVNDPCASFCDKFTPTHKARPGSGACGRLWRVETPRQTPAHTNNMPWCLPSQGTAGASGKIVEIVKRNLPFSWEWI